jgi:hypothetical protein
MGHRDTCLNLVYVVAVSRMSVPGEMPEKASKHFSIAMSCVTMSY